MPRYNWSIPFGPTSIRYGFLLVFGGRGLFHASGGSTAPSWLFATEDGARGFLSSTTFPGSRDRRGRRLGKLVFHDEG